MLQSVTETAAVWPLTCAPFLQGQDLQVEAMEHGEVLLPEEHHAPLHTLHLPRQAALIIHGHVWRDRTGIQKDA